MPYLICGAAMVDSGPTGVATLGRVCILPSGHREVGHFFADPHRPSGKILTGAFSEQITKIDRLYSALEDLADAYRIMVRDMGSVYPERVLVVRQAEAALAFARGES